MNFEMMQAAKRRDRRVEGSTRLAASVSSPLLLLVGCWMMAVTSMALPVQGFSGVSTQVECLRIHPAFLSTSSTPLTTSTAVMSESSSTTTFFPHRQPNPYRLNVILQAAKSADDGYDGLGEYDPSEGISPEREVVVGDPQLRLKEKERSVTSILKELAAIQQQGPQKYCILGTRHCSYLHQQIIELL